jgi:hypothetical protein
MVIENIVGNDSGDGERAGEIGNCPNPPLIVAAIRVGQCKVEISTKRIGAALYVRPCGLSENLGERQNEALAFRIIRDIGEFENALSLAGAAAAQCK